MSGSRSSKTGFRTLVLATVAAAIVLLVAVVHKSTNPDFRNDQLSVPTQAPSQNDFAEIHSPTPLELEHPGPPVQSPLDLQLVGTLILKLDRLSLAALYEPHSNTLYAVRKGDEIRGTAKIEAVDPGKVIFWNPNTQRNEFLLVVPKNRDLGNKNPVWAQKLKYPGFTQISENHFEIEQDAVQKTLANLPQVLTEARCLPAVENGRSIGFRCTEIVPGSVYARLDIQNGDVICGLNNAPLDNLQKAMEALNALQGHKSIDVCVIRGGKQMTRQYDIR